jgi:DNA (cytosine-5)-methyltransferase 1
MIVDLFAGGGGASLGIEWALGRAPDVAVNHDDAAVAMHKANHPKTTHLCGNVWDYHPAAVCEGKPVELLWASPDCTHFSRAKGGKPKSKNVRGLAWVVARWAREVHPAVIILENVAEFQTWGPLDKAGQPIRDKSGFTFRRWVADLKRSGYVVEWRELRACDYGAPTSRKRLFLVARCDGKPIVWPAPTHGPSDGGLFPLKQYRTAAECIDWSIPVRSIFDRKKPLADKTLRRIARGVMRYVVGNASPFVVPLTHAGDARVHGLDEPFRTVTAANRGELALVAPTLIQTGYGEREGQAPRALDIQAPMGTVVAGGGRHALVAAFLARHYGGHENDGQDLRGPMSTVTTQDHHALVVSHLTKFQENSIGQDVREPMHTVMAGAPRFAEVRAFLTKFYGTSTGSDAREPLGAITAGGWKHALVTVDGAAYEIADIGMRMLTPRELFRAQGFPDSYVIDPVVDGKPLTKTAQIEKVGNSVCPQLSCAMVAANCGGKAVRHVA